MHADARQIFEKWMQWEPDHHGWMAYIKFELRGGEVARARNIYERYVACIPSTKGWVRFAKFEAENGDLGRSRLVYERALQVRLPLAKTFASSWLVAFLPTPVTVSADILLTHWVHARRCWRRRMT